MQIINGMSRDQLVPLVFAQDAVAASQTAVALFPQQVHGAVALDNVGYTLPWAGEIVAISANLTATSTGGTIALAPTIDTVAVTDPVLSETTGVAFADTAKRNTAAFAAKAVIGCSITTAAGWTAETMDLVVIVWVTQKIKGI